MEVTIKNFRQFDNGHKFTVDLGGFVEIHDCRVVRSGKGDFVGVPARKGTDKDGKEKWYNHVWFAQDIQTEILRHALKALNAEQTSPGYDDSDVPF